MEKFIIINSTNQTGYQKKVNIAIEKGYVPIGQPSHQVETQITSSSHLEQLYYGYSPVAVSCDTAKTIHHFSINMIAKNAL